MNPLKVCPQCGTEYPANARFCEIDGTALRSAGGETDMVGSIVADRYHILKKLGEGGMGQVYLAEHVKMGRKSALKVMHPGMVKDIDSISRFNREAANASRISHPNVAAVYDFGETADGVIYLAMEFVDGPALTRVIEQAGALPPKRAGEIVRQTGEALAVAHDMGIVHRDLKPDNIMVAKTRDGGDLVKVVDFGIAKAAGNEAQKVTKTGLVVGTPEYMSPEQLAGDKLDGRSDIYSLGLVAFNMLTGKLPFPSDSAQESMIMRLTDKPKPLAEMKPEQSWPADVQAVMDKALERDAALRYQTATEFGLALYQAIDRMPETVAGELGTQMIAVPATRVSAQPPPQSPPSPGLAVPSSGGPSTVAVPTPVAASAPATVTQAAAPAKKRSKVPVLGGVAAVVVIGAAGAWMARGGATSKADTGKALSANEATSPKSKSAPVGEQTGTAVPPIAANSNPGADKKGGPPSDKGTANSAADQLRALIDDSKNVSKGQTVLAKVARIDARSSEEIYLAASLKSNVFSIKGDSVRACSELKDVLPRLAKNEADQAKDRIETVLQCP